MDLTFLIRYYNIYKIEKKKYLFLTELELDNCLFTIMKSCRKCTDVVINMFVIL